MNFRVLKTPHRLRICRCRIPVCNIQRHGVGAFGPRFAGGVQQGGKAHASSSPSAMRATETTSSPAPVSNTLTPPADRDRLRAEAAAAVAAVIVPARQDWLAFLETEYLPQAPIEPGLGNRPGGKALYAYLVRGHTTTDLTPDQIAALSGAQIDAFLSVSPLVLDLDGNGVISAAERSKCLAFLPEHLPGGGDLTGPMTAMPRTDCSHQAWKNVLGDITPAQIKAWSDAQERNGLHAQSQPPRSIYWVDSAATWTQSLGQPDAPVLLVFSAAACSQRCPSLASGVRISGTVVLQSQCQDEKTRAWRAGQIEGQLVVESGLPDLQNGSHIHARTFDKPAYQVTWPVGMDASQVQRVSGSWREANR